LEIDGMPQKETSTERPTDWVNLLLDHDEQLERVRMLWRRGGGAYRPMVPFDAAIDRLQTESDWDRLELGETHFMWTQDSGMGPTERRESIEAIVDDLWEIAVNWTRTRGVWCDFQLHGFDVDNHVLFEQGRRLYLTLVSPHQTTGQSADQESTEPKVSRREFDWRLEQRLDKLLDRFTEERDKSATNARESLDAAKEAIEATPQLFSTAREVLCETIDYQRQQFEHLRSQGSGRYEAQAKVLGEMEHTKRAESVVGLCRHVWDTLLSTAIPFADRVVEVLGDRNITVFPEFKQAQQALNYLVLTLTPHQLNSMMPGKQASHASILAVFNTAAKKQSEREALRFCGDVARRFLGGEEFRSAATPEQQLAARFIIGRIALYKIQEFEEHGDVWT
jgi:hypothetical protein